MTPRDFNRDVILAVFAVVPVLLAQVPLILILSNDSVTTKALCISTIACVVTLALCLCSRKWQTVLSGAFGVIGFSLLGPFLFSFSRIWGVLTILNLLLSFWLGKNARDTSSEESR